MSRSQIFHNTERQKDSRF